MRLCHNVKMRDRKMSVSATHTLRCCQTFAWTETIKYLRVQIYSFADNDRTFIDPFSRTTVVRPGDK